MQDIDNMISAPFYYSIWWLIAGIILMATFAGILGYIFYTTRRKQIKTLSTLRKLEPHTVDMNVLREKYLRLIDEVDKKYNAGKLKSSEAHQELSLLVRLFFCEAMGFHAEVMTLNDLKRTNYTKLAKLIDQYYPDEFDTLENGVVQQSIEHARDIVRDE